MIRDFQWPLANHLWQSTLFALAAGLLTLAFRRNRATVRYFLWLAASFKFLIPFSLLVGLGNQFEFRKSPAAPPTQLSSVIRGIGRPFTPSRAVRRYATAPPAPNPLPAVLFCVWFCGFAIGVSAWLNRWRHIRAAVRAASPLKLDVPLKVMCSSARLEPGVFGLFRPVLLLPDGIADHLTPAQLQAIVAHEISHVRRRDNLAAAVHMAVEALFWFHPLVWWIEARLVEERERACDEEVLRVTGEPHVYAEAILNICKLYMESPLVCVSGVTGSNLRKRIEAIMTHRIAHDLTFGKKMLLAVAGIAALAAPVTVGVLNTSRAWGQPAARLAFEAASIKPNKSGDFRHSGFQYLPGGKLTVTNIPAYLLIAQAYDVRVQTETARLSGGPEWLRSDAYDIVATPEPGAVPSGLSPIAARERVRLMLQTLLADRFKLSIRRETKDLPVYRLIVAANGPKLQKAKIDEKDCVDGQPVDGVTCHQIGGGMGRGIHGQALGLGDVTGFVENWADRPVLDKTGLKGLFTIDTDGWAPMRPRPVRDPSAPPSAEDLAMADPARPTLFMIFDKLGLKLEPQRAPVETFVIERIERPTEN